MLTSFAVAVALLVGGCGGWALRARTARRREARVRRRLARQRRELADTRGALASVLEERAVLLAELEGRAPSCH